ncbi:MAG: hypothetical protein ABI165_13090 [Bryobacteraceae bacterium]
MDQLNQDLDNLLAAYRAACAEPEAGDRFMPGLWRKIEARQSSALLLTRWSKIFVTAAAALTLLMGTVLIPHLQSHQMDNASYVDVLAADHTYDNVVFAEALHPDLPAGGPVN